MKIKKILLLFIIILTSCKERNTVNYLTKEYSLKELEIILKYKINKDYDDATIKESNFQEKIKKISLDTLILSIKTVYGINDDRIDFNNINDNKIKKNALGVFLMLNKNELYKKKKFFFLDTNPLEYLKGLCENEKFYKQPTAGFCTAFAVNTNTIITAGHCLRPRDLVDPSKIVFLLGFKKNNDRKIKTVFKRKDYFTIKKIKKHMHDKTLGLDYALIETNEPIHRKNILKIDSNFVEINTPVYVLGHPSRLPLKLADNAIVRNDGFNNYQFKTNLDTFGGNSGSPVFNANNHKVIGILSNGDKDYITIKKTADKDSCKIPYPCLNFGCKGEGVSRTNQFFKSLNK